MEKRNILFSPPDIAEAEINEVVEALKSGWITTGPRTKKLEKRLAEYIGVPSDAPNVVCLNSATAAEEMNLRILGIGPGDEVIVPAYTYTATASAVIHVGANVVFADSQEDSCEMDYDKLFEKITSKTKAIVFVELGGVICDYEKIVKIIEQKRDVFIPGGNTDLGKRIQKELGRVAILSDCAHALGATRNGKMAGTFADFSSFSFHAVKNFTTAEGGASVWKSINGIDNAEIYKQIQLYSLHGQSKDALAKTQLGSWEYDIVGPWFKCNMTDVVAAIGLKQLDRYPQLLERRREIISRYDEMCFKLKLSFLKHNSEHHMSSGHLYLIRIPGASEIYRNRVIEEMAKLGVATNVHYKPLPLMTAYRNLGWSIDDFPNAYAYYKNLVSLPLHTKLTDDDVEYICECLEMCLTKYEGM